MLCFRLNGRHDMFGTCMACQSLRFLRGGLGMCNPKRKKAEIPERSGPVKHLRSATCVNKYSDHPQQNTDNAVKHNRGSITKETDGTAEISPLRNPNKHSPITSDTFPDVGFNKWSPLVSSMAATRELKLLTV